MFAVMISGQTQIGEIEVQFSAAEMSRVKNLH